MSVLKGGSKENQNDDSFAPLNLKTEATEIVATRARFAIADGATESAYSGRWARELSGGFGDGEVSHSDERSISQVLKEMLPEARIRWAAALPSGNDLPWFLSEKVNAGAFATFLGLELSDNEWTAIAVGDSCLAHIRHRDGVAQVMKLFPIGDSKSFGNTPGLLPSRPKREPQPVEDRNPCVAGDELFLMTDALAHWFVSQLEKTQNPWDSLTSLFQTINPAESFVGFVVQRRLSREMHDDDTTLLWIRVEAEAGT
jgi:hypothetical protein